MKIALNKAKLVSFIILLSLLLVSSVCAATYFVDTNGNNLTSDGSSGRPWKTIAHALSNVGSGDTISINNGTYNEGQLVVPSGVNLTSSSQNHTKVKLQPNTNLGVNSPFILLSSTPGSNGNQTISHLEIDGINGGNKAYVGIAVKSRNNVRIHHCYLHDFYGGTYRASAVSVESVQIAPSDKWWLFWPADPQAPGTDTNINALWPSKPVTGFELDNNTILEGGYKDPGKHTTGAVQIWHLKDSIIHHNTITTTATSKGQCITGMGTKTALLDNVDIYNNTFDHYVDDDKTPFAVETWVHKGGCDIYNNHSTGWFSITVGKETDIYDNFLTISPAGTEFGIGIEFNMQSYSKVYRNYIENAKWGIITGFSYAGGKNWKTRNVTVSENVIYNSDRSSIWVSCLGAQYAGYKATVDNIDVFDNRIVGESPRGSYGTAVSETDYESTCALSNVHVKGNIIQGMPGAAGKTSGAVANLLIEENNLYGNGSNSWQGSSAINTNTNDPGLFTPPTFPINGLLSPPTLFIQNGGS